MYNKYLLVILAIIGLLSIRMLFQFRTDYVYETKLENYYFVFYTIPSRNISLGPVKIGLRIQDQDYKIVVPKMVSLEVINKANNESQLVNLKLDKARDSRGKVILAEAGEYQILAKIRVREKNFEIKFTWNVKI